MILAYKRQPPDYSALQILVESEVWQFVLHDIWLDVEEQEITEADMPLADVPHGSALTWPNK